MRRPPAVAGQFYQGSPSRLAEQVETFVDRNARREKVIGIVSPHAGLIYSGHVAGAVYSSIEPPSTFVLLGPNHTGLGPKLSLMEEGEWEIPTGVFRIDKPLADRIALNVPVISKDTQAHMYEHSLEVQLPFIASISKDAQIVPIILMSATVDECRHLGEGIAKAVSAVDYPVVLVASSDMSHYVSDATAKNKDKKALDRILSFDPEGLYETVIDERISMCGYLPVVAMMYAAQSLGARSARLVKYATSAEVSGDYDRVVGYAGVVLR